MKKFIIAYCFEDEDLVYIKNLMDQVASITGQTSPYNKIPPHITFHRPIENIHYEKLKNIVQSSVLKLHTTRFRVGGLGHFGNQFIVMPVNATRTVADFWITIQSILSQIPEYHHGQFDHDNTLHITLASDIGSVFNDEMWTAIKKSVLVEPRDISVKKVQILGKNEAGIWEICDEMLFPEKI